VVQASQEASAKRQAQIKEAESFLRWFRGFGFDAQPVFDFKTEKKMQLIYHFRVFLGAVTIILVFLFGSFFWIPSNQDCLPSHQLPLLQTKRLQKNPQRDL